MGNILQYTYLWWSFFIFNIVYSTNETGFKFEGKQDIRITTNIVLSVNYMIWYQKYKQVKIRYK